MTNLNRWKGIEPHQAFHEILLDTPGWEKDLQTVKVLYFLSQKLVSRPEVLGQFLRDEIGDFLRLDFKERRRLNTIGQAARALRPRLLRLIA